jgi:signal transduction histidine kinase
MRLVGCPLPETQIAGQRAFLLISLETAWLLRQKPNRGEANTEREFGDPVSSDILTTLLAHSPPLLLWCISRMELEIPLCHPNQLLDKLARLLETAPDTSAGSILPGGDRLEMRTARFVERIERLAHRDQTAESDGCEFNRGLASLASHLTGIERDRMGLWVDEKKIQGSFWRVLSRAAFVKRPQLVPLAELSGVKRSATPFDDDLFATRLHDAKMASMKRLAYGASHEINNPLANIASRAQTLLRDETNPERRKTLAKINLQAFRAFEMIADMMLFAHPPQIALAECNPADMVRQIVGEMQEIADEQETILKTTCCEKAVIPPVWRLDPVQLAVALRAIIQNALESLQHAGQIVVEARTLEGEEILEISVVDDGPGFREAELPHVFDPFFSGREAGRGLGFGLAKAWRIMEQHKGRIFAENLPHGGARVRLRIPYRNPA